MLRRTRYAEQLADEIETVGGALVLRMYSKERRDDTVPTLFVSSRTWTGFLRPLVGKDAYVNSRQKAVIRAMRANGTHTFVIARRRSVERIEDEDGAVLSLRIGAIDSGDGLLRKLAWIQDSGVLV